MISVKELSEFKNWQNISLDTIEYFLNHSKFFEYKEDTMIYLEGEDHPYLYIVLNGFIVINRISSEGKERYLFFLTEEDILNSYVVDNRKTTTSAKTHTDVKLLKIHKRYILKLMEQDFNFNMMIIKDISKLARRSQRQMLNVGIYDTRERITARLWKLSKDYGLDHDTHIHIDLPLTQSDLSNVVGTSRETVNRTLKELEEENLIRLNGREIIINNRDKLIEDLK